MLAHAIVALTACQFERPADKEPPADASADAAPLACTPSTQSCTDDLYSECDASGAFVVYALPNGAPDGSAATITMHDYPCPLGCHGTEPRCNEIATAYGLDDVFDAIDPQAGVDLTIDEITGPAQITAANGQQFDRVTVVHPSGRAVEVPILRIPQPATYDLIVVPLRSLTIAEGARLRFFSDLPFVLLVRFDAVIAGELDYSGKGLPPVSTRSGCDVVAGTQLTGGAGNATTGGDASDGALGGASIIAANPSAIPLERGCSTPVGAGGGAVALTAGRRISLGPTSVINVSARGGQRLGAAVYGGGAGGTVVLEAPTIGYAIGATIQGRGGGGAAANITTGTNANGAHGDTDLSAPPVGGSCVGCGVGGGGGTEAMMAGDGTGSAPSVGAGGGAVGRCVIRTRTFTLPPPGAMRISMLALPIALR